MERDFAGSRVRRADFQRLAALCKGDPKFPATYDDWLRLVNEGERRIIAEGKAVMGFDVDPADFEAWCHRVSIHICFDALRAYLIVTRRSVIAGAADKNPFTLPTPKPTPGKDGTKRWWHPGRFGQGRPLLPVPTFGVAFA